MGFVRKAVRLELCGVFSYCGDSNGGQFRGLEADGLVGPIAKRLVGGVAAAAERDGSFSAEVPFVAVAINKLNGAFDAEGPVKADGNLDFVFRHGLLLLRWIREGLVLSVSGLAVQAIAPPTHVKWAFATAPAGRGTGFASGN